MEAVLNLPLPSELDIRKFQRSIDPPLTTAKGTWNAREGWYLRWTDQAGCHGYGEVAPFPPFGGGTIEDTLAGIKDLQNGGWRDPWRFLRECPHPLPALAFGLWSASRGPSLDSLGTPATPQNTFLAASGDFQTQSKIGRLSHFKTFKVKSFPEKRFREMDRLLDCLDCLQPDERLRIDPNGSWSPGFLKTFMAQAHQHPSLEFVEQPLPETEMAIYQNLPLPWRKKIALDETVNSPLKLKKWQDWPGIFVVKPSLFGMPEWFNFSPNRMVLSSAFETEIGFFYLLKLAESYAPERAVGYGTARFTGLSPECQSARLYSKSISRFQIESIWDQAAAC